MAEMQIGDISWARIAMGAGAQMSNGMRSVIVSIAEMVSFIVRSFKAGIPENVEPHHSGRDRLERLQRS
jgi:hypothetical protein